MILQRIWNALRWSPPITVLGFMVAGVAFAQVARQFNQYQIVNSAGTVVDFGTTGTAPTTNITQTGGNSLVADDATAGTTAPVPMGGIYNSTLPTYTNLDRAQAQFGLRGSQRVQLTDADGTNGAVIDVVSATGVGIGQALRTSSTLRLYNSTNTDLWLGAANSLNSTGTGLATAQVVGQCDDTSPTALTENSFGNLRMGCANHELIVGGLDVDDAAASTTRPVPVGGKYNLTLPTYTDGDRTQLQFDARGALAVTLKDANGTVITAVPADALANATNSTLARAFALKFNGSTWDRDFACTSQAQGTVTAGNTTEVIALSGSTTIRVCNFIVDMTLTGTYQFQQGTGTNCGTNNAVLTPAFNALTATPVIAGTGVAAVLRTTATGRAICIAAVTGDVKYYISYAQY